MSNFADVTNSVDVLLDEARLDVARFHWHNGQNARGREPGSFYIKHDNLGFEPGAPWRPDNRFQDEIGYSTERLKIAVVGVRMQAYIPKKDAGGREIGRVWLPNGWREGGTYYTEGLCLVEGFGDVPAVWASKGLTSKAFNTLLKVYQKRVLKPAEFLRKRRLPLWTFWLDIAGTMAKDGKALYLDTGHRSTVTPPDLALPATIDEVTFESMFVGRDLYLLGDQVRRQFDDWLRTKHTNEVDAAPATNGNGYTDDEAEAAFERAAAEGELVQEY